MHIGSIHPFFVLTHQLEFKPCRALRESFEIGSPIYSYAPGERRDSNDLFHQRNTTINTIKPPDVPPSDLSNTDARTGDSDVVHDPNWPKRRKTFHAT